MATVVISPVNVVSFREGGGHFWVYMQYVQGLRQLGCEVYWLERFRDSGEPTRDTAALATFAERMERYGLAGKCILYTSHKQYVASEQYTFISMAPSKAQTILRRADLLLNFDYCISRTLLSYFQRTALVDIDPGLLQFWMATRQLIVPPHDVYFTTGESVGTPSARFPDGGCSWVRIRPPICLECWPSTYDSLCTTFTTVSSWWGQEYVTDGMECYDNNKRTSFLDFLELPRRTSQQLELALFLGEGDVDDQRLLESYGWSVRHSREVAGTPEQYQTYIQQSRGEFSCAKPSCMKFQTAWVSDRTLCYLASGKPVVVQDTGPSSFLPNGEGMWRFATQAEAVEALAAINRDYARQCRAARALAETYFDAKRILRDVLDVAF